ncbi:hypothetical protein HYPSUDRAFT_853619 [Hypholoma sublateritium FD-334 SS-4]|uniref:Uncharacterized protein n=1 Tax=Hypholoma sublateritium (strain FD-334 SS-4) TaxID=945553 RepID=A0A0D2KZ33_HYPSF|nr:hypothetical protein HYPSUDRAFT_853619 [Hypholoma sublateritium FD-334 SS-4]
MRALAARLDEDNPTVQLQKACLRQQQQERQAQLEEERIEREEEEEHQALLAATRASLREMDELLLPPTPTASQSFTVSGLPVTRATTSNRPTITTQMNSTWTRDFEDRTQVPLALAKGGKNKIDKAMVHRFRIILWLETRSQPSIFVVQECPKWPNWKRTDSVQVLNRIGEVSLEFYDMLHGVWVECDTTYVHTGLETDAYLLFRRVGILCEDFDKHLNTAGIKPINQRVYMRNTRQALKGKGKARQVSLQSDSSEDTPIRKSVVKLEPSASSPSPFKRARRHSPSSQGSSLSNAIEILDSPAAPSPLRLYSFSPPPVFSPPPAFSP